MLFDLKAMNAALTQLEEERKPPGGSLLHPPGLSPSGLSGRDRPETMSGLRRPVPRQYRKDRQEILAEI